MASPLWSIKVALSSDFQVSRGTALATFTQRGTYSAPVYLGGGWLVGMYSDNWPTAAGSVDFRSAWGGAGTGYLVQNLEGTVLKLSAFGSGTMYTMGYVPWLTAGLEYVILQIGTAGTAGVAAGGTIVLVTST